MRSIPQYTFHKNKYGEELLIDIVELTFIKKITKNDTSSHTLTYYDITLITEGSGLFKINDQEYEVCPGDVVFTMPGDARGWDVENIYRSKCY